VQVRLLVRADGTVGRVDVLASSGDPELDRATVAAMSRWRFDPARRGGTPVDSYYVVWVRFVAGP
jgi:protein TonB